MQNEPLPKNAFDIQAYLLSEIEVQVIFDIGANTGQTSSVYRSLFPSADIYGFEPFPETYEEFVRNNFQDPKVKPVRTAVSNSIGTRIFYANQNNMTNSLFPATSEIESWVPIELMRNVDRFEVPSTTIDVFCEERAISEAQILKMDIQGGELLALEGATKMLSRAAITLIYTEILMVPLYSGQAFFNDVYSFLARYGYSLFNLYNFECAGTGQAKWADALFLSPRMHYGQNRALGGRRRDSRETQHRISR